MTENGSAYRKQNGFHEQGHDKHILYCREPKSSIDYSNTKVTFKERSGTDAKENREYLNGKMSKSTKTAQVNRRSSDRDRYTADYEFYASDSEGLSQKSKESRKSGRSQTRNTDGEQRKGGPRMRSRSQSTSDLQQGGFRRDSSGQRIRQRGGANPRFASAFNGRGGYKNVAFDRKIVDTSDNQPGMRQVRAAPKAYRVANDDFAVGSIILTAPYTYTGTDGQKRLYKITISGVQAEEGYNRILVYNNKHPIKNFTDHLHLPANSTYCDVPVRLFRGGSKAVTQPSKLFAYDDFGPKDVIQKMTLVLSKPSKKYVDTIKYNWPHIESLGLLCMGLLKDPVILGLLALSPDNYSWLEEAGARVAAVIAGRKVPICSSITKVAFLTDVEQILLLPHVEVEPPELNGRGEVIEKKKLEKRDMRNAAKLLEFDDTEIYGRDYPEHSQGLKAESSVWDEPSYIPAREGAYKIAADDTEEVHAQIAESLGVVNHAEDGAVVETNSLRDKYFVPLNTRSARVGYLNTDATSLKCYDACGYILDDNDHLVANCTYASTLLGRVGILTAGHFKADDMRAVFYGNCGTTRIEIKLCAAFKNVDADFGFYPLAAGALDGIQPIPIREAAEGCGTVISFKCDSRDSRTVSGTAFSFDCASVTPNWPGRSGSALIQYGAVVAISVATLKHEPDFMKTIVWSYVTFDKDKNLKFNRQKVGEIVVTSSTSKTCDVFDKVKRYMRTKNLRGRTSRVPAPAEENIKAVNLPDDDDSEDEDDSSESNDDEEYEMPDFVGESFPLMKDKIEGKVSSGINYQLIYRALDIRQRIMTLRDKITLSEWKYIEDHEKMYNIGLDTTEVDYDIPFVDDIQYLVKQQKVLYQKMTPLEFEVYNEHKDRFYPMGDKTQLRKKLGPPHMNGLYSLLYHSLFICFVLCLFCPMSSAYTCPYLSKQPSATWLSRMMENILQPCVDIDFYKSASGSLHVYNFSNPIQCFPAKYCDAFLSLIVHDSQFAYTCIKGLSTIPCEYWTKAIIEEKPHGARSKRCAPIVPNDGFAERPKVVPPLIGGRPVASRRPTIVSPDDHTKDLQHRVSPETDSDAAVSSDDLLNNTNKYFTSAVAYNETLYSTADLNNTIDANGTMMSVRTTPVANTIWHTMIPTKEVVKRRKKRQVLMPYPPATVPESFIYGSTKYTIRYGMNPSQCFIVNSSMLTNIHPYESGVAACAYSLNNRNGYKPYPNGYSYTLESNTTCQRIDNIDFNLGTCSCYLLGRAANCKSIIYNIRANPPIFSFNGSFEEPPIFSAGGINYFERYLGCYADYLEPYRTMTGHYINNPTMSHFVCMKACLAQNIDVMGLQYSTHCFCGTEYGWNRRPDPECSMQCLGNFSESCGGGLRNAVYRIIAQPEYSASSYIKNYAIKIRPQTCASANDFSFLLGNSSTKFQCASQCASQGFNYSSYQPSDNVRKCICAKNVIAACPANFDPFANCGELDCQTGGMPVFNIVKLFNTTTWSYTVNLTEGDQVLSFTVGRAEDRDKTRMILSARPIGCFSLIGMVYTNFTGWEEMTRLVEFDFIAFNESELGIRTVFKFANSNITGILGVCPDANSITVYRYHGMGWLPPDHVEFPYANPIFKVVSYEGRCRMGNRSVAARSYGQGGLMGCGSRCAAKGAYNVLYGLGTCECSFQYGDDGVASYTDCTGVCPETGEQGCRPITAHPRYRVWGTTIDYQFYTIVALNSTPVVDYCTKPAIPSLDEVFSSPFIISPTADDTTISTPLGTTNELAYAIDTCYKYGYLYLVMGNGVITCTDVSYGNTDAFNSRCLNDDKMSLKNGTCRITVRTYDYKPCPAAFQAEYPTWDNQTVAVVYSNCFKVNLTKFYNNTYIGLNLIAAACYNSNYFYLLPNMFLCSNVTAGNLTLDTPRCHAECLGSKEAACGGRSIAGAYFAKEYKVTLLSKNINKLDYKTFKVIEDDDVAYSISYLGCYVVTVQFPIVASHQIGDLSMANCASRCTTLFMGLSIKTCSCFQLIPTKVNEEFCNMTCNESPCGGQMAMSVYTVSRRTQYGTIAFKTTLTPQHLSTGNKDFLINSLTPTWNISAQNLGCLGSGDTGKFTNKYESSYMTIAGCAQHCVYQNMLFSAVVNTSTCFCLDEVNKQSKGNCYIFCSNGDEWCGPSNLTYYNFNAFKLTKILLKKPIKLTNYVDPFNNENYECVDDMTNINITNNYNTNIIKTDGTYGDCMRKCMEQKYLYTYVKKGICKCAQHAGLPNSFRSTGCNSCCNKNESCTKEICGSSAAGSSIYTMFKNFIPSNEPEKNYSFPLWDGQSSVLSYPLGCSKPAFSDLNLPLIYLSKDLCAQLCTVSNYTYSGVLSTNSSCSCFYRAPIIDDSLNCSDNCTRDPCEPFCSQSLNCGNNENFFINYNIHINESIHNNSSADKPFLPDKHDTIGLFTFNYVASNCYLDVTNYHRTLHADRALVHLPLTALGCIYECNQLHATVAALRANDTCLCFNQTTTEVSGNRCPYLCGNDSCGGNGTFSMITFKANEIERKIDIVTAWNSSQNYNISQIGCYTNLINFTLHKLIYNTNLICSQTCISRTPNDGAVFSFVSGSDCYCSPLPGTPSSDEACNEKCPISSDSPCGKNNTFWGSHLSRTDGNITTMDSMEYKGNSQNISLSSYAGETDGYSFNANLTSCNLFPDVDSYTFRERRAPQLANLIPDCFIYCLDGFPGAVAMLSSPDKCFCADTITANINISGCSELCGNDSHTLCGANYSVAVYQLSRDNRTTTIAVYTTPVATTLTTEELTTEMPTTTETTTTDLLTTEMITTTEEPTTTELPTIERTTIFFTTIETTLPTTEMNLTSAGSVISSYITTMIEYTNAAMTTMTSYMIENITSSMANSTMDDFESTPIIVKKRSLDPEMYCDINNPKICTARPMPTDSSKKPPLLSEFSRDSFRTLNVTEDYTILYKILYSPVKRVGWYLMIVDDNALAACYDSKTNVSIDLLFISDIRVITQRGTSTVCPYTYIHPYDSQILSLPVLSLDGMPITCKLISKSVYMIFECRSDIIYPEVVSVKYFGYDLCISHIDGADIGVLSLPLYKYEWSKCTAESTNSSFPVMYVYDHRGTREVIFYNWVSKDGNNHTSILFQGSSNEIGVDNKTGDTFIFNSDGTAYKIISMGDTQFDIRFDVMYCEDPSNYTIMPTLDGRLNIDNKLTGSRFPVRIRRAEPDVTKFDIYKTCIAPCIVTPDAATDGGYSITIKVGNDGKEHPVKYIRNDCYHVSYNTALESLWCTYPVAAKVGLGVAIVCLLILIAVLIVILKFIMAPCCSMLKCMGKSKPANNVYVSLPKQDPDQLVQTKANMYDYQLLIPKTTVSRISAKKGIMKTRSSAKKQGMANLGFGIMLMITMITTVGGELTLIKSGSDITGLISEELYQKNTFTGYYSDDSRMSQVHGVIESSSCNYNFAVEYWFSNSLAIIPAMLLYCCNPPDPACVDGDESDRSNYATEFANVYSCNWNGYGDNYHCGCCDAPMNYGCSRVNESHTNDWQYKNYGIAIRMIEAKPQVKVSVMIGTTKYEAILGSDIGANIAIANGVLTFEPVTVNCLPLGKYVIYNNELFRLDFPVIATSPPGVIGDVCGVDDASPRPKALYYSRRVKPLKPRSGEAPKYHIIDSGFVTFVDAVNEKKYLPVGNMKEHNCLLYLTYSKLSINLQSLDCFGSNLKGKIQFSENALLRFSDFGITDVQFTFSAPGCYACDYVFIISIVITAGKSGRVPIVCDGLECALAAAYYEKGATNVSFGASVMKNAGTYCISVSSFKNCTKYDAPPPRTYVTLDGRTLNGTVAYGKTNGAFDFLKDFWNWLSSRDWFTGLVSVIGVIIGILVILVVLKFTIPLIQSVIKGKKTVATADGDDEDSEVIFEIDKGCCLGCLRRVNKQTLSYRITPGKKKGTKGRVI